MSLPNLANLSADQLTNLAQQASALAADLSANQPSYQLALAAGVQDRSYNTTRFGFIASYSGTAIITMSDGRRWQAVGHGPCGSASYVSKDGFIEFIPLD